MWVPSSTRTATAWRKPSTTTATGPASTWSGRSPTLAGTAAATRASPITWASSTWPPPACRAGASWWTWSTTWATTGVPWTARPSRRSWRQTASSSSPVTCSSCTRGSPRRSSSGNAVLTRCRSIACARTSTRGTLRCWNGSPIRKLRHWSRITTPSKGCSGATRTRPVTRSCPSTICACSASASPLGRCGTCMSWLPGSASAAATGSSRRRRPCACRVRSGRRSRRWRPSEGWPPDRSRGPALASPRQVERGVAVGAHLGDLGGELRPPPGVEQVLAGLAGDVRPEVVADLAEVGLGRPPVDHAGPALLGGRVRLDDVLAALAQEHEGVGDEVHLVPVVARIVASSRVGTAREEQVREPRGLQAEIGLGTVGPVLGQQQAVAAAQAHAQQCSRPEVEPGGPHHDVEFPHAVGGLDPRGRHPHHGRGLQVDEGHVGPVERLVVAGHEGRTLLGEPVVLGDELLGRGRVADDGTNLLSQELAPCRVGLRVGHQVGIVADELGEARAVPHPLEKDPAGLGGVVERGAVVRLVEEARRGGCEDLADLLEVGLELGMLLRRDGSVVEWSAPVGGALVDGEGRHLVHDGGHDLDAAGPGADHRYPLAGEVHRLHWPEPGVVGLAAESVASWHVGDVGHRQHAGGRHQEARPDFRAVVGGDLPHTVELVPRGRHDPRAEAHVTAQVEPVDDVVEIALDLGLRGEALLPVPLLEQLPGEEVPVRVALGVEPGPWVPVPVPRPPDPVACFEQLGAETRVQGTEELVDAGNASAGDEDVAVGLAGCQCRHRALPSVRVAAPVHPLPPSAPGARRLLPSRPPVPGRRVLPARALSPAAAMAPVLSRPCRGTPRPRCANLICWIRNCRFLYRSVR